MIKELKTNVTFNNKATKLSILNMINEYLTKNGITHLHTIDEIGDLYEDVFDPSLNIFFQYPTIHLGNDSYLRYDGKIING